MSVRKSKTGWIAYGDLGKKPDGTRDRRQKLFKTRADAKRQDRVWEAARARSRGESNRMTLSEFIDEHFWPDKSALDDGTLIGYRRDVNNRIVPSLGNMELSDIRRRDVQSMISSCPTFKVAKNAHDTLSSILGWAVQLEYIEANVARGQWVYPRRKPRTSAGDGVWLASFDEIVNVLEKVRKAREGQPEELICLLGLCLGLRKGEILGLDWTDVDFGHGIVHVMQTYTPSDGGMEVKVPKTERSERDIPMLPYLEERLAELHGDKGPIVTTSRGRMAGSTATRRIAKLVAETGIPAITCKSMRHSFATACIDAGMDVAVLARILGHTNASTTYNRYVRPLDQSMRRGIEDVAGNGAWKQLGRNQGQNPR